MDMHMVNVNQSSNLSATALRSDNLIYNEMKICLYHCHLKDFPIELERNILNLLPKKYRKKYCSLIELMLNEVKDTYIKDMQDFLRNIVLLNPSTGEDNFSVAPQTNFKFINEGETLKHSTFLNRRKSLEKRYFLSLEPIKVVINEAQVKLPVTICDFERYHHYGLMSLTDFQHIIMNDIKKGSVAISNRFYITISKSITESNVLKNINCKKLPSIMKCITHVFVQQILNVMIKSIDHMLNFLSDGYHSPQLRFQLILRDGQLLFSPSIEETYSAYHSIIEKIGTIAENLIPLEQWLNIKAELKYIKVILPDWYIKESNNRLLAILNDLFHAANKHVANITAEFQPICAPNAREEILSLTAGKMDFDTYLKNIQSYNTYFAKADAMVSNIYYTVGKLEQSKGIEAVKRETGSIINAFLNKLIKYHQEFNLSICSAFEDLKAKVLNVPRDPKLLIKLTDYISNTLQDLIKELEDQIQRSIHMIVLLSEITLLSEDHIQLNVRTINWLHEVEPILKQSNILIEAMKNELEDDMQKRISDLNADVDNIVPQLCVLDNMDDINNIEEYVQYYKGLLKQAKQINYEMQRINEEENLFKFPETEFPNVIEIYELITSFYDLIYIINQWQKDHSVWLDGPFEWLDATVIERRTLNYFERITEMSKAFKMKIKMDVSVNKCFKFIGIADDPDPLQQPAPLKLCWQVLNQINDFKKYLPLVICMCNPALKKRHWIEMSAICNFDLTPNAGTSLRKIIAFNLMDDIKKYEAISIGANRELELEEELLKMIKEWDNISFEISFEKNTGVYVFSNLNDIELLLENHLIKIEEMKTSNFVKQVISTVSDFFISLTRIREIIDQWYCAQSLVYFFNSTFCYPNIEVHLPEESTLYEEVKGLLENIQIKLSETPTFAEINDITILMSLNDAIVKLEYINQKVKNYMEIKKLCFPRFCFLSDEEIQEILFESTNLNKLQFLVQKCFEDIQKVKSNDEKCISSVIGDYEEEVKLENFVSFHVQYKHEEAWLIHLEEEINTTIRKNMLRCNEIFSETFEYNNIINFPSMIIVCVFQMYWTAEVHKCLTPFNFQALNALHLKYITRLNDLINELKIYSIKKHRNLLTTLITIAIRQKDIIKLLLDKNIIESTDFEWVAQLRYYLEDDDVRISIFQTNVKYEYEYSYYKQDVITTPLTDRCYHTLMQAYNYHLYGAIAGGPATGKSETIKSLAKAIAMQFRVFNCATILSYNFLSQIFKGFILCGAWLCFENFDKLRIELVARITETLTSIFQAIATSSKVIMFEGSSLKVNPIGHICVVTQLGLCKYIDLPDNLKRLFRTVSMLVPDMKRIVEVELLAAGMCNSKVLATKIIIFYKMLSQQLWCKTCNTFNLYSIKAIVKTIIYLKRSFPDENETTLLLRALLDINLPKLCETDIHIFKNIVIDMFPGVSLSSPNYTTFLGVLETICKSRSIQLHNVLKLKIIQAFELMYIFQSLILVGDPFVGKTEILNILRAVLLSLHEQGIEFGAHIELETLVPGAIDIDHIFGHFDKKSNLWKDGICSKVIRSFSESDSFGRRWIIFDGPLSNAWFENLYTVLGTNDKLPLTSGEKINIASSVSIIFEMMSITNMSPAIVSKCGIVYIESSSIDWRPYAKTYFSKRNIYDEHEETLYLLFNWALEPCLQFVQKYCTATSNVGQLHYVMSALNLFELYLGDTVMESVEEKGKIKHFLIWVQITLLLAVIWGLGGNLDMDSHTKFNSFCISLWSGTNIEHPKPGIIKCIDVSLPHEGLIQDNFYIFKGVGNWKYWGSADVLKNEQILEIPDCNEIFIPTVNTMKYNHMLLKHIKYRKPFVLCGEISIGKTCLLKNFLKNKLPEGVHFNWFSFLSLNTVPETQRLLLSKLNKISRRHYGLPTGQLCINFIDDLSAQKHEHTTEVILELVRQCYKYGYFYDINEPEKIFIQDIMYSLSITGSTITKICPRFLRHFHLYTMYPPTTDTIFKIFSNVLFNNWKKNSFTADVLSIVTSISNATIDIYNSILTTLLPIPAKFQYQFNMRDITKVIGGCSLLQKESVETKVTFVRLWAHEVWRVFGDRIINNDDKEWLFQQVKEVCKRHFKDSFETAFDYLPKCDNNEITKDSFNNLMFGNFMNVQGNNNQKYEEINSIEKLKDKIHFYLSECNNNHSYVRKRIDIVVSQYVLDCLIKISRILAIPGGHLLMISSIGSGRKSLASLAAYMQQQELFEPSVHSYYDFKIWRKDLKTVLQKCGGLRENLTLFLKDKQGRDNFFRDIICFLATGDIPDLFSTKDRCDIIKMVRLYAQDGNKNTEINNNAVINYFLEQCKTKLHIIISFNTTNKAIKSYLYKYPELVKYCTINWYEMWPLDTLTQIGLKYIQDVNIKEDLKLNVIKVCVNLHNNTQEVSIKYWKKTGHKVHVTLSAFLHILKLYIHLMSEKQKDIQTMKNKYIIGLEKLELAAQQVEKMKATLTILKPQLESSAQKTLITMREVETENVSVEKATILVQQEEEIANKKAEIAGRLKTECEADLAVAIPILEDAITALNTLKPMDITLVKAMKNPPDTVKLVMAAICVMLDVPPDRGIDSTGKKYTDYWSSSKRILSDMNFLQILKDYDKDNIPPNIIQIIKETYISDNNFMPHIVAKASSAAEGLCKWVRAMVSYNEVAKAVAPKKEKWFIAQEECNEAEAFLNEKRKTLSTLNAKLAILNNSLQETLQQKLKLENEVKDCTNKLLKAENLMASLGGEKNRWLQFAENLQTDYDNLVGDMILTCGTISYLSSYNITSRNQIIDCWKQYLEDLKVPYSIHYNLVYVLGVENDVNCWHLSGSHKSNFSIENTLIMKNSKLWPLLIDSENEANRWIKAVEKKNKLKVIKLTNSDCLATIQHNIENGIPTLIENVGEKLEILLDPFLLKGTYNQEGCSYLDTGYDIIKYALDFRLYITTRLNNPQFSCEIFSKLTIINFSIPNEALQDRLLDFIISKEKPELQEKFEALLMEDTMNKNILKEHEGIILNILFASTTNILEDECALKSLDSSKSLSLDVIKKQKSVKAMSSEINQFRNVYIQFVQYCVEMFNTLTTLLHLNHMYRFPFTWFMLLYKRSIETSNRSIIIERRLKFLKSSFTQTLYSSVCKSLSEKHKISYSFLLCSKILLNSQQTTEEEIKYFVSPSLTHFNGAPNYKCNWLPQNIWINIYNLSKTFPIFSDLADSLCCNDRIWEEYYKSESLQDEMMPEPWISKLSLFQKLILVKILRPDRILIQITRMIEQILGNTSYSPKFKVSESYIESNCLTPLLFILPASLAPLSLISAYAKVKGCLSKFRSLSMSEGQEDNAEILIQKAQREGSWVLVQNCHLVPHWMIQLERICESFNTLNVSLNFRLWLSSYPIKDFPISILQNSIKIVHDYPLNIKDALLNIYQSEPVQNKDFFEGCPGKDKTFLRLLFGICLFHAVIEERKNFGIQGWNIPYKFDHSDLQISVMQLRNFINNTDDVPFKILLHLIGECNYGEKVGDELDKKCLKYLLRDYCNSNIIERHTGRCTNNIEELIPQGCEYDSTIEHIEKISVDFSPQVFGCDRNSIVIRNTVIGAELLSYLSCMIFSTPVADKELHQDEILILINDISDKLSNSINLNKIPGECTSMLQEPLQRVLLYEIKSLKHVVETTCDSLNNLKVALHGGLPFTESLKEFAENIYRHKVPHVWTKVQGHMVTTNLSYYIDNLLKHSSFINDWINEGHPKTVWFDALFHHEMFISAISLILSKKYDIPVEEIIFDFEVTTKETTDTKDVDTYLICGLYLYGARWDFERNILTENSTNETWQNMPPVRLKYSENKKDAHEVYDCPVYVAAVQQVDEDIKFSSKSYIFSIPLKTDMPRTHWAKCGTALFCHIPQ